MVYPHQIGLLILVLFITILIISLFIRKLLIVAFILLIILILYEGAIFKTEYELYINEYNNIIGIYRLSLESNKSRIWDINANNVIEVNIEDYKELNISLTNKNLCKISQITPFFDDTIGVWKYSFFDDRPLIYIGFYNKCQQFEVSKSHIGIKGGFIIDEKRYLYQLIFDRIN